MLTINNKPYITLDKYLNINKLLSLKSEWEFLAASNHHNMRTAVWNSGGHDPHSYYQHPQIHREKGLLYYVLIKAKEDAKTDSDLARHLEYFESKKDLHGLSRYLKLRYHAFDPYNILNIRQTTGPFYAADSYTFTEKEWAMYHWCDYMDQFPSIKNFIEELPLEKIGVVTVFYNEHYVPQGYHRDYNYFPFEKGDAPDTFPHRQELIWFRFDLTRPFYLFDIDEKTGTLKEQIPLDGYTAFFNHHNWHGSFDIYPNTSITVKVEGKFTDEFRKEIGIDHLAYYN